MSTIVTRAGKGSSLTWAEGDANVTNLNTDKYQSGDSPSFAAVTVTTGALTGLSNAYSNVLGLGVTPTAWSNTLVSAWALQVGDKAAFYQFSGVTHVGYNVKVDSAYADVAITASGTPALLSVGAGDIVMKTAAANPGAGSAITFTTVATAKGADGNLNLDCGQLKFPIAHNPSSNVYTLDDYREGTFTPTDGSGAGLVFAAASGSYTKIGNLVQIQGAVVYPATANGSNAKLGSLPFQCGSTTNGVAVVLTNETTVAGALVDGSATTMTFYNTALANVTNATMSGDVVYFSATYQASA